MISRLRGKTPATVSIVMGASDCQGATTPSGTGTASFWWTDVLVYPPAWLRAAGINVYLYRIENYVVQDAFGALMEKVGAQRSPMETVDVTIGKVTTFGASNGSFALESKAARLVPGEGGGRIPYREIGAAREGYAVFEAVLVEGDAMMRGPGTMMTAEGSVGAQVFGPLFGGVVHSSPRYRFDDARMLLVAPPA